MGRSLQCTMISMTTHPGPGADILKSFWVSLGEMRKLTIALEAAVELLCYNRSWSYPSSATHSRYSSSSTGLASWVQWPRPSSLRWLSPSSPDSSQVVAATLFYVLFRLNKWKTKTPKWIIWVSNIFFPVFNCETATLLKIRVNYPYLLVSWDDNAEVTKQQLGYNGTLPVSPSGSSSPLVAKTAHLWGKD